MYLEVACWLRKWAENLAEFELRRVIIRIGQPDAPPLKMVDEA